MDEDGVRRPAGHQIGMALDSLSIDELTARIAEMEREIARLRQAITDKGASRDAAEAVFRL